MDIKLRMQKARFMPGFLFVENYEGSTCRHDARADQSIANASFVEEQPSIDDRKDTRHALDSDHVGRRHHGNGEIVANDLNENTHSHSYA